MSGVDSLLSGESKLAAPPTKRQCISAATENPNSAWGKIICLVRQDAEKEKDELWVRMLLSLSFAGPVGAEGEAVRSRFVHAAQQLIKMGKEAVLVQYFLALFERTKCWDDWPDEAKSKPIANATSEYLSAFVQALVKAADVYRPGLDPDWLDHLLD